MSDPDHPVIFRRVPRSVRRGEVCLLATRIGQAVTPGRRFLCLVADDRELLLLNRRFLKRDYPADVLSFPEEPLDGYLGEIAISAERAGDQARERGHGVEDEIGILMLHGVLHLLGMDHQKDRGRMARAERRYRAELGLPEGLIERARP